MSLLLYPFKSLQTLIFQRSDRFLNRMIFGRRCYKST
nr:MAG TPA: hypothetical protein [Caudoviricetes sp.]